MKQQLLVENMSADELRFLIQEAVTTANKNNEPKETDVEPIRLSAQQAADYLGIPIGSLYNLKYKGKIPYHKPPGTGKLIFFKHELDKWIQDGGREVINE